MPDYFFGFLAILLSMKRKFLTVIVILALCLCVLPACKINTESFAKSSVKAITRPYIAQYECVEARFGEDNLIEYYDYIKVILLNKNKLEILYKLKDGDKKSIVGTYNVDTETREIDAEVGILGYKFKKKVKVENGEFIISHIIMKKELYMKFQTK